MKQSLFFILLLILACNSANDKPPSTTNATSQVTTPAPAPTPEINKEFQDGDIIFHTSLSNQSMAIQLATNSKYSHVGVIYKEGEQYYVYEAVQPVKLTPLSDWIKRGKDGKYVLKRLKNSQEVMTTESIAKMKAIGKKYRGRDYDLKFEWSDDKIYCSELAWKVYKETFNIEIGTPQKIKDFDLSDPAVQKKVKERYGDNVPMEEIVVTPDRMFQSDKLLTVMDN